jgi:ATP synthase protein I
MTEPEKPERLEELSEAVRIRQERRARWEREGERSVWKNMSMIGSLAWLVVVPMLLGTFFGRILDRTFSHGIFWTATMIFLGATFGCYLAWQRIKSE